nr:hypothetical protein [Tanacetum cinerariifolium]
MGELTFFLGLQVKQKKDRIFISQDKYVAEILRKFGLSEGKSASTLIDAKKPLLKDSDVKRIFRYLKGKPYLGLWYLKDSPFDLVAYSDSNYAGASLDRKSTTGGCQFLRCRLISWQCKKQTVVATSSTEAEYVAAGSGCAQKSDVAEGFEQVIDFLSGNYIHYALTVNPHIYISCIKQFWNTASVKRSGVVCLPNEEIFVVLAQMGYEKPSTKLTFYKAFLSSQWKFLIHSILQFLSAKRTSWNEFSTAMASAVISLSKGQKFNFSKYIFDSLVRNVDSSSKFYMYPRFIQLIIQNQVGDLSTHTTRFISPALTQKVFANMRRVGKGFSGVKTHLFEGMLVAVQTAEEEVTEAQVQVDAAVEENFAEDRVENLENDNAAQKLVIIKLKERVKRLEKANIIKSSKLRHLRKVGTSRRVESFDDIEDVFNKWMMIDDMDMNEGIELVKDAEEDDSKVQEVVEVVTTAKLITEVVTAAASQVSASSTTTPVASAIIPTAKPSILAAAPTVVATYTRRRKGVIFRDLKEELPLKTPAETPKVKDKGKGILVETPKPMKKKDQIEMDAEYARKLQEEIDRDHDGLKNDINWDAAMDHNTAGYKIDFFKGMTYASICLIFQARFDENMRFLFKSREEMEEEDQEIIKSLNETPALKAVKRRKLSEEAQEVEDLRKHLEVVDDEDDDVFVEATPLAQKVLVVDYQIVLIDNKPRYPLSRFTVEQLVNVTRLQVEEENKFIKSSVEDLFPILSESKDTSGSKSVYNLPSCDDFSPNDIPEEKSVTFSNLLFNSNADFISSDDESLFDEDILKDNVKIYSNPLFEFDDEYISSDINPIFNKVLEDIECKDSYDPNLDESTFLVTPLSNSIKDEYFTLGDDVELLLHHDPSIPKMSVASILEGFIDEPTLEENDELFD